MDLKFLPYKLESCINGYKKALIFLGATYYERLLVFEHTKKLTDTVLGFSIEKVELAFELDCLVSVWLFIKGEQLEELLNVFQSYYCEKPKKVDLENFARPTRNIQYYWANEIYLVGIGHNHVEGCDFVYVTLKNRCLYHIEVEN